MGQAEIVMSQNQSATKILERSEIRAQRNQRASRNSSATKISEVENYQSAVVQKSLSKYKYARQAKPERSRHQRAMTVTEFSKL